jgi:hypothetical protein
VNTPNPATSKTCYKSEQEQLNIMGAAVLSPAYCFEKKQKYILIFPVYKSISISL